jgi:hypothetical protein
MSMSTVSLNSAWFSGNSGPPWVLNAANTQYVLAQDVRASGNYGGGALFALAPYQNIELNLAGYHIYYNGFQILQPCDSDFPRSSETTRAKPGFPLGKVANDSVIWTQPGYVVQDKTTLQ